MIKAWQQTPGRQGRRASRSPTARRATRPARSRPASKADVVQLSTGLDIELLVKAGLVDANWNRQSAKGIATNSIVVFAVRDGNPKKIKNWNDLAEAGRRDRDAEPALVRRGEVERDGGVRRAAAARQDRQAGASRSSSGCSGTSSRSTRPAATRRTRSSPAAATSSSRTRTRRGSRSSSTSSRARRCSSRRRSPSSRRARTATPRTSSSASRRRRRPQRIFAQYGFRPLVPSVYQEFKAVPAAAGHLQDRRQVHRRLERRRQEVVRPRQGHLGRHRQARPASGRRCRAVETAGQARPAARAEGEGDGPLPRLRRRLPLGRRRAADGRARLGVDEGRLGRVLGGRLEPAGASPR